MRELDPIFRTGIAELDDDHGGVVALLSAGLDALNGGDLVEAWRLAVELVASAERHFAREERVLAHYGYPRLQEHAAEHAAILALLRELAESIENAQDPKTVLGRADHMRDLLLQNLLVSDMDYKWWFLDRAIKPDSEAAVA